LNINFTGTEPQYMSLGAAGADLEAAQNYTIVPGEQVMIDTGTALQLPEGHFAMYCPRSSLCNKKGLRMVNSIGVGDMDYIGTIRFVYHNVSDTTVKVDKGERIGQVVILPYVQTNFTKVDKLESTERGEGGFGSTGK
jgi:dUTP pyrophosphatase